MADLTTLNCPRCDAPISGPGTCPYCHSEVRATGSTPATEEPAEEPWRAEARALMADGRKIAAIKVVRAQLGCSLKDAKYLVEQELHPSGGSVVPFPTPTPSTPPSAATSSGQSCFPASAQVSTPRGLVSIAALRPGDRVWSFTAQGGRTVARVSRLLSHPPAPLWTVVCADRPPCVVTGNHRLLTENGWQRVDQLEVGAVLRHPEGTSPVLAVGPCDRTEAVYNLYTTGPHTFIVDGCVAHCFTTLPLLRAVLHRILIDPWFSTGPTAVCPTPD